MLIIVYCNCTYILFTKLPWPEDSKGTLRSSSQAATLPTTHITIVSASKCQFIHVRVHANKEKSSNAHGVVVSSQGRCQT